jgi:hypothetical protein
MLSGVDEAYLFDSLQERGQERQYKKWYGRLTIVDETVTIIALGTSAIISWALNTAVVFIAAAFVMLLAALYTLFLLPEPKKARREPRTVIEDFEKRPFVVLRRGARFLKQHYSFVVILIAFALLDESGRLLWQPRLLDVGYSVSLVSIIYAVLKLFSILGAWLSSRLTSEVRRIHFAMIAVVSACAFLLMSIGGYGTVFIGLALFFLCENIFRVFRSEYLNARIESTTRATVLSLNSFGTSVFSSLFVIGLGAVADQRLLYGFLLLVGVKIVALFLSIALPRSS